LIATHGRLHRYDASAILRSSGVLGGSAPWHASIEMALASGLVAFESGKLSPGTGFDDVASLVVSGHKVHAQREILALLIRRLRPELLVITFMDERALRAFVDPDTVQCLLELGLLECGDSQTQWWDSLENHAKLADQDYLKRLGDLAEERSLEFERTRLLSEGYPNLAESVQWMSRLDESLGYDILSFAGNGFRSLEPEHFLRIEVKACGHNAGKLRFFLTRNEWTVALQNSGAWFVHFWRVSDLHMGESGVPFAQVTVEQLRQHVPSDVSQLARWTVCEVFLPDNSGWRL
jgi:hypothetical protein